MKFSAKKITTLAIMAALAYLIMLVGRIPIVLFLKYDPKDIVIVFAGFLFGPFSSFLVSLVVSLIEMLTASDTGPIGFLMNVLASCAFACTASFVYKKKPNIAGAGIGLAIGAVMMTVVMLLWNYFITPFYMGVTREEVGGMLAGVFLPFNLLKSGLNATITVLLYKPVLSALRRANLVPAVESGGQRKLSVGVILTAAIVLVTCVMFVLVFRGII